jgi:hypothetical protein
MIRCRGCENPFRVPSDTPPMAIALEIDGIDARSCPQCGRTFAMKAAFADKTIRCRGCRVSFRVASTQRPVWLPGGGSGGASAAEPPGVFHDVGDVMDDMMPGEPRAAVVRTRAVPQESPRSRSELKTFFAVIAVGLVLVVVLDTILGRSPVDVPPFVDPGAGVPPQPQPPAVVKDVIQPAPPGAPLPIVPPIVPPVEVPPAAPESVIPTAPPPARLRMQALEVPDVEPLIRDAYAALQREDFAAADRALAEGKNRAARDRDATARVGRWQLLAEYARKYLPLREEAFKVANQGREYELDGEPFAVIEITATEFIYLRKGKDRRLVPRAAVDPRIEMAIVGTWLRADGRPANHIYLGVRWLCCVPHDRERCRAEWEIAANRGAPVTSLLPLLDDPVILGR